MSAPLPQKQGVAPSYLWLPEGVWPDMLSFLVSYYPHIDAATWKARMARGEVVDRAGLPLLPETPYVRGRCMFYYRELDAETPIPFQEQILFRDAHLLVVDKPHFLPVTPGGRFLQESLLVRLKNSTGLEHLTPIHRLDRETAGVVMFSHNPDTRGLYQSMFQKRVVDKLYHALAPLMAGRALPMVYRSCLVKGEPFFRMREIDGCANAETHIDLLEQRAGLGLYALRPVTGRQHQLRVHMAALGCAIVNDGFYPEALPCKQDDFSQPLQLLAKQIAFADPLNGTLRQFESLRKIDFPEGVDFYRRFPI